MDVWILCGLAFVILSLLQGTLVNYIDRKDEQTKRISRSCLSCKKNKLNLSQFDETKGTFFRFDKYEINKMSRFLFPVAYLIFNIIYWVNCTIGL